jgi:hypothetical protein
LARYMLLNVVGDALTVWGRLRMRSMQPCADRWLRRSRRYAWRPCEPRGSRFRGPRDEIVARLDEARERLGLKTRMDLFRKSLADYLTAAGEHEVAQLFTEQA